MSETIASRAPELAVQEVLSLHDFFEGWLSGRSPSGEQHFDQLSHRLALGFEIVTPDGSVLSRASLIDGLAGAFASRGITFRLWVRSAKARMVSDDLCLVTYEEWQNRGDGDKGRMSSALLRCTAEGECTWVHVHETKLP